MSTEKFTQAIQDSYTFKSPSIYIGSGIYQGEIIADARVNLSLRMMNRPGKAGKQIAAESDGKSDRTGKPVMKQEKPNDFFRNEISPVDPSVTL